MTGRELRDARLRLRMSQKELARKMGKHRNTISAWETGRRPIGVSEELAVRFLLATVGPGAGARRRGR